MQNKTMGIDADLVTILKDIVKFLEALAEEISLPSQLENDRMNLLHQSKLSLSTVVQRSASPEPYLDMNAGKGKGLFLVRPAATNINDNLPTEYIDTDNPCNLEIPEYESFQEVPTQFPEQNLEEDIKAFYRRFSAEQTKLMCECKCQKKCVGKCHSNINKCGTLFQKEERKIFGIQLFDQLRECWIGLLGRHLLIYNTKNDKHPTEVISIRGYSARPATDVISRDPDRIKPAFEIFCLGEKTYQFMTKHPKEAEQWIAVINKVGAADSMKKNVNGVIKEIKLIHDINTAMTEEPYQDIGVDDNDKSSNVKEVENNKKNNEDDIELRSKNVLSTPGSKKKINAPPLPARIPRRLPSLPHDHEPALSSHDSINDGYDMDCIYHDIEDLKQPSSTYENLKKMRQAVKNGKQLKLDTYDDIADMQKKKKEKLKKKKTSLKKNSLVDTYDDIQTLVNNVSQQESVHEEQKSIMYDDIEIVVDGAKKDIKESPRKKSFLDRMRNKKESSKKEKNKKISGKEVVEVPNEIIQELPTYDDVNELSNTKNTDLLVETMTEYLSPPPPRPIYVKPPTIDNLKPKEDSEELYDDIGVLKSEMDIKINDLDVKINGVESPSANDEQTKVKNSLTIMNELSSFKPNEVDNDVEHYQVPRPQDPIDSRGQLEVAPVEEQLYDDIAILVDFRTRQRDSACSNSSSEKTFTNISKAWTRFASGRK